jgi:two-component system, cell cycle response regulator DivK
MAGEPVLVVEDNAKSMKLFRDVLQATGYRTFEATTGEEAIELARTHLPALVLMDVRLPGIDGVEALARLRKDERTACIPVVVLTAQAMQGDRERFLEAGFDGYLAKPVDLRELLGAVGALISRGNESNRAARLVRADDADRRRIERELHDGVQQDLTAFAVVLQQVGNLLDSDPAAARALVDELRQDVHTALARLRVLAQRIYPPMLEAGGLGVALRSAAANAGVRARIDVALHGPVPPEVAGVAYFCCVEAISGAATGTISVRHEPRLLAFEIVTDRPADLGGARDRVEALGGRLSIEPEAGGGARVVGSLPL